VKAYWIEASAGCGKTTFLLKRLQEKNFKNALFLTFSNAAVQEMQKRTQSLGSIEIQISTVHSLAYSILNDEQYLKISTKSLKPVAESLLLQDKNFYHAFEFLLKNEDTVLEFEKIPEDFEINVDETFKKEGFETLNSNSLLEMEELEKFYDMFFTKAGDIRKKHKFPDFLPADFQEWAIKRILLHKAYLSFYIQKSKNALLRAIEAKEIEVKKDQNSIYYEDLISGCINSFKSPQGAGILFKFFANVDLILIDEAQDLSQTQLEFLYLILAEWKELDGEVIVVSDPKQLIYDFQGANIKAFYDFKSRLQPICDYFEQLSLNTTYRLPLSVCAMLNQLGPKLDINYLNHSTARKIEGRVRIFGIRKLEDLVMFLNEDLSHYMFLFRQKNEDIKNFALFLIKSGFFLNSHYMMMHPIIEDFQHLINWLIYEDHLSLSIIFNAFGRPDLNYEEILGLHAEREFLFSLKKENDLEIIFYKWINFHLVKEQLHARLKKASSFYINFLRLYAKFYRHDFIAAINDENNFFQNHAAFFENGMFFNTIHASKGKEANHVFLLNFEAQNKVENDRLLYVALTRVKESLYLPIIYDNEFLNSWAEKIILA
jgi:superfamily I DNA/RNA helicase